MPHGLLAELEYLGTKGTNLGVYEAPGVPVNQFGQPLFSAFCLPDLGSQLDL